MVESIVGQIAVGQIDVGQIDDTDDSVGIRH
jgi:hypothetical protein